MYHSKTSRLVYGGIFAAMMAVGAFIKLIIPVGPFMVTFSLQFLFALLAGIFLGGRGGFFSVVAYLVTGLIGVPVFAHGGGLWYIAKPTFGFLIGFAFAALLCGWLTCVQKKRDFISLLLASAAGEAVYYLCGLVYYYIAFNYFVGGNDSIGISELIRVWLLSTVGADFLLCVIAALLSVRLLPAFERMRGT